MHDESSATSDSSSTNAPSGCGYRIGALAFFGFAFFLVLSLLRGLAS